MTIGTSPTLNLLPMVFDEAYIEEDCVQACRNFHSPKRADTKRCSG